MAFWNTGAIFNRKGDQGGFTWNGAEFLVIIRLNETLRVNDKVSEFLARFILQEKTTKFYDSLIQTAFLGDFQESFRMEDEEPFVALLFFLTENLGIKDEFTDLIVKLFLEDKQAALDDVNLLVELLQSDEFSAEDIQDIHAFFDVLDRYGLEDLKEELEAELFLHDKFAIVDHEPREAISDFVIGTVDQTDKAYDYLIPFGGMRVDWSKTSIVTMPKAELTEITMPDVDGSLISGVTYRDRLFSITAFSNDGMTVAEKEDLKRRITAVLDSTKHASKKLTIQSRGISFDARYEDEAKISDGPSFVKLEAKFRVGPYGHELFPVQVIGSGLLNNVEGAAPLRVKHIITGPITNPSFSIDGTTYTWIGTVPSGYKLIINHQNYTCFTVDNLGNKQNVLQYLEGEFTSIPAGSSAALVADENTKECMVTEYSTPLLW